MKKHAFELVNVFSETRFGGNPLAVFPEADDLTAEQMQLIARQFNLSEVVFCQTATDSHSAKMLRIFKPDQELPFAGHPTIGAAFVLHQWLDLDHHYSLQTHAGRVVIRHDDAIITLTLNQGVKINPPLQDNSAWAGLLGVPVAEIADAHWVNTGSNQLLIRLHSALAVQNCQISQIDPALFRKMLGSHSLYIWHAQNSKENRPIKSRLFFCLHGAMREDPGTGSAAANLGGWHVAHGQFPLRAQIMQGDEIQRPSRLALQVDEKQRIHVGGPVIAVGKGEFFVE